MNLLIPALATLAVTSPSEVGREVLFEDDTTQVLLQKGGDNNSLYENVQLVKWSSDRRARLVLSCNESRHLGAKILVAALGFDNPEFSQVLAYRLDGEKEIRIHGRLQPASDTEVEFHPDPDFLRASSKSNTRFYRDIVGDSLLAVGFKVGGHYLRHNFSLDDINPRIVKLGKRCGRDLTGGP